MEEKGMKTPSGSLPTSFADFETFLRQGGTFRTQDQGMIWFQNDTFWYGRRNMLSPFQQVEGAVLALMGNVGTFEPSPIPGPESAQERGILTAKAANQLGFPELANTVVLYLGAIEDKSSYAKVVYSQDGTHLGGIVSLGPDGILPVTGGQS